MVQHCPVLGHSKLPGAVTFGPCRENAASPEIIPETSPRNNLQESVLGVCVTINDLMAADRAGGASGCSLRCRGCRSRGCAQGCRAAQAPRGSAHLQPHEHWVLPRVLQSPGEPAEKCPKLDPDFIWRWFGSQAWSVCPEYNCRTFLQCNLCMKFVVCVSLKAYFGYFSKYLVIYYINPCAVQQNSWEGGHRVSWLSWAHKKQITDGSWWFCHAHRELPHGSFFCHFFLPHVHRAQLPDSLLLSEIPPGAAPCQPR